MQVVHHAEHSSRRQQHRRSTKSNNLNPSNWRPHQTNNENSSDVEGTAHRVASVTLNTESDSRTSADAPMSFRSKRRKKLPRREKGQGTTTTTTVEMEVDEQQSPPWKKQSVSAAAATVIPTCKLQMDWEHGEGGPSGAVDGTARSISVSDMDNNQSDNQLSFSDSEASASNVDADDEQSDWPGNELVKHQPVPTAVRSSIHRLTPGGPTARYRPTTAPPAQKDAALSAGMVKRIEHFLREPEERELLLDQVYRTSTVKQMLRGQPFAVQIVKRGRGTVALKKN